MSLTILGVAYPLAPVAPDTAGGAEQVLLALDRALTERGHRSVVVAQEGSTVHGTLVPTPTPAGPLDEAAVAAAQAHHRAAIAAAISRYRPDVVHLHGIDFAAYLPAPGVPVLATLHLPISWYGDAALRPTRPDTWLHCVSSAQQRDAPPGLPLLPPIANGIDVDAFGGPHATRPFALMLARICPEKGIHLALDAARIAGVPLLIGGTVFGYEAHRRYFADEVAPRLDRLRRFLGPVGPARKRRLLAAASCVLVPSTAPETSSLVAREALASGTPVIAFPNGALPETIAHGRTGFLVRDVDAMAAAIPRARELDRALCRRVAAERFRAEDTVAAYLDTYARLAGGVAPRRALAS